MEFLFCFFQIIKNFIHIFSILSSEFFLVFNKALSCLYEAIIIANLVKSDNILIDSFIFIQWLLFFENSVSFIDFGLINFKNYWLYFYLFWWLVVSSFKFFVCGFKISDSLIDILLVLSWEFFLLINELLAKLHVLSIVMVSFLNGIYLSCLWKQHAKCKWSNEFWF